MPSYTPSEAKQWARENIINCTNAPTTPFKEDFSLDKEALAFNVNRYAEIGLYGLMTGGNMAEAWNMTPTEWYEYTNVCAEANNGRMMLTSVILDPSPFTVVEKANVLDELGYDLIEVINPVLQLRSDDDIYGYFKYLNDNQPLAIALYNTATAGVVLNHGLVNRLSNLEKVVAIKNGLGNPADTIAMRKMCGDRIVVTEPNEAFFLWDSVVHGAQAIYGTLEVIMFGSEREKMYQIMELAKQGKMDAAVPIFKELEPLRDLLGQVFMAPLFGRNVYNLAPIKYWMELLGYKMGVCRPPLAARANDQDKALIAEVLLAQGVITEADIARVG
ncbi:MAG: dihydrodipicolinate synthase family protein [Immundisolibacteraceae bacterium]|nr:dihydrodipicolinate synthase family protein [Immundisolibacteraceae bacterium]